MPIYQYEEAIHPGVYDPYDLKSPHRCTEKQARAYFEWHQAVLQERISYLLERCSQDSGVPVAKLREFPSGTLPLWEWFLSVAEVVPTTQDERLKHQADLEAQLIRHPSKVVSDIVADMTPKYLLSVTTEAILRDIAMYVGDGFTRISSKLHWELYRECKSDYSYNHAVVRGFASPRAIPGKTLWLEPIGLVRVQALHLLDGSQDTHDLLQIVNVRIDQI